MKYIATAAGILLVLVLAVSILTGCGKKAPETITIGISKIVTHPALDAIEQGIMDGLSEMGVTDVVYDLQNANGEIATANSIALKFKNDNVAVAIGIATPTAQALANAIQDVPVVFSAVTEPIEAGLVTTYEKGLNNVTGVSDLTPVEAQILLLKEVAGIKKLGMVYTSGEANAVLLADMAKAVCLKSGIEFVPSAVSNSAEVKQAAQAIAGRVDGFYVSNDNTVVSALPSLAEVALLAGIPIMSADTTSASDADIMMAWGFDYYKLGKATAGVVKKVLNGADPAALPVVFMTDPKDINLLINLDTAGKLGITIPESILQKASIIIENGVERTL